MGGEKGLLNVGGQAEAGSPPRGRGKGIPAARLGEREGITPAWAGKSIRHNVKRLPVEDHPRVGGEKSPCVTLPPPRQGSPPRGRGKD